MVTENGETIEGQTDDESGEEIAEEIAEEITESDVDVDVDIAVIEAPEVPQTSYVDVGDLHISGPPEMVKGITEKYLKDHLDHNPHGEDHTPLDDAADTVTPDVIQETIEGVSESEIVDVPPGPSDWLFRERGGQ